MILENIDFLFLLAVMAVLVVAAVLPRKPMYYAFNGACAYVVHADGTVVIQDELYGKVMDKVNGYYILRIPSDIEWLAHEYVQEGKLIPVHRA